MIRVALAVSSMLAAALVAAAVPSAADNAAVCQDLTTEPRAKIKACSRVIDAGQAQSYTLAMAYFSRATAYEKRGEAERAMTDLDAAIRVKPNELFHLTRGGWHEARRDFSAAIADYSEAIRLASLPVVAYVSRIRAYRAMGDLERALADCDTLIGLSPKSPGHRVLRGDVYRQRGDLARAIADYREALRLDPNHRTAGNRLAQAEREQT